MKVWKNSVWGFKNKIKLKKKNPSNWHANQGGIVRIGSHKALSVVHEEDKDVISF